MMVTWMRSDIETQQGEEFEVHCGDRTGKTNRRLIVGWGKT